LCTVGTIDDSETVVVPRRAVAEDQVGELIFFDGTELPAKAAAAIRSVRLLLIADRVEPP
jgi:hypothetical protein